jgi:glycosyltransferase involved in cell wall biosynthesis
MDRSRVAIVIPALNESATISDIVRTAAAYGVPIVVDDGSTDGTAELARLAGATVVRHERNLGYDAALNSGFKQAAALRAEVVVTLDADGQHDPGLVQKLLERIDAGADVVVGTRSRRHRLAEHLFAWYTTLRFGIRDPLCGLKAYRRTAYDALGHFDSYDSIGTELMLFAARAGYRLRGLPFQVGERRDRPRFGRRFAANLKILRAMLLSTWRVHPGTRK